jgi:hypothetical protein
VAIADAQHPAIIGFGFVATDLHKSEVSGSIVAEAVGLVADNESVGPEGLLNIGYQGDVGDGSPCVSGPWGWNVHDLFAFDGLGSAMKEKVRSCSRIKSVQREARMI